MRDGCGRLLSLILLVTTAARATASVEYPGPAPGAAEVSVRGDRIELQNQVLQCSWHFGASGLEKMTVKDLQTDCVWESTRPLFRIVLADGTEYCSSSLRRVGEPIIGRVEPHVGGPRLADRCAGMRAELRFATDDQRLEVVWRAVLLDDANYVRQELVLRAPEQPFTVREVAWLSEAPADAVNVGSVDGTLVVLGTIFLGCEDPMAQNRVTAPADDMEEGLGTIGCRLPRQADLSPGEELVQSFVIGVTPPGQLRRGFLYYLERERAHPYRPYLHYNSWYDIAWQPFALQEENCLDAIRQFGERLILPHGVVMDAMVFDDGWDDPHTLWQFHARFPRGFTPLAELCRHYDTRLGVWLSPFGGYGEPREQRLAFGREQGYETNATGFSLAGPRYYGAFQHACINMIREFGVNHFKFDGIAQGMHAAGAGEYLRDTEAMRRLMLELRQEDPNLYINLTTGSWPSPFWLRYADSLWRQGGDMGLAGVGTPQQQWLTYRDQETYRNIVCRSPLYPLNALMTQGVAYSRQGSAGDPSFTSDGFRDDVRAFFGSGTGLQELYIQPGRLTDDDWRVLAEAAKWSRASADVLVDTHWIGGDPGKLEVYGFASWSPRKGIVMLRNPAATAQDFTLEAGVIFELPPGAARSYLLRSPWTDAARRHDLRLEVGVPVRTILEPFEVMVLEALPVRDPADSRQ